MSRAPKTLLETLIEVTEANSVRTSNVIAQADETAIASEKAGAASERMSEALRSIATTSGETVDLVRSLQRIADQTHIVALNAAIVAAGVGEAGKAFEVVAEQIRALAGDSMEFARQSEDLMTLNHTNATSGVKVAQEVCTSIREVHGQISSITNEIRSLSSAQAEQVTGLRQMRALAVTINVAGSQRMLSQRMAKEFFLIALGSQVKLNRKALKSTCETFHKTLQGLISGDREMGLIPPANDRIRTQLEAVAQVWREVWEIVRVALDPEIEIDPDVVPTLAQQSMVLLQEMHKAVSLYQELA